MKTIISWKPALNRHLKKRDRGMEKAVLQGELTAYGLVLHPLKVGELGYPVHEKYGWWSVSDPISGGCAASAEFPGRLGAVAGLIRMAVQYQSQPGGFRGALERARKKMADAAVEGF